ncbi:MAG TPA: type II toxin-antitoxin system VapC family toxin [Candidatus Binatia bacterium]|nr:type II toxin-antitoxin system VapC family toxin [Candidatus Binatia bacterium]
MGRSILILLDTHVVIWLAQDYERISAKAQAAIQDARKQEDGLAVSCITLVEIARLANHARIRLTPDAEAVLAEVEDRFVVLPITRNIALQAFELPDRYPNDPADRIIGATALIEDIPLLTADQNIRRSRTVPTIW